jgi:hypothetical protein
MYWSILQVAAIWECDKALYVPSNRNPPPIRGMRLRDMTASGAAEMQKICSYAADVLSALGITQGPASLKIICRSPASPLLLSAQSCLQGGEVISVILNL